MPNPATTDVDTARQLVAEALEAVANDDRVAATTAALAKAMSENVRGWTHTTRLRDFLESVNV